MKEFIINTFDLKLQLLPATSQDSGELTFWQDCCSAQNTLFNDINISQGSVVTHFRWGGIFNYCFIANFLENVTVKEFWKPASIWRSCVDYVGLLFWPTLYILDRQQCNLPLTELSSVLRLRIQLVELLPRGSTNTIVYSGFKSGLFGSRQFLSMTSGQWFSCVTLPPSAGARS